MTENLSQNLTRLYQEGKLTEKDVKYLQSLLNRRKKKDMLLCEKCGEKTGASSIYCIHCGEKLLNKAVIKSHEARLFCKECGKKIPPDSLFCNHCGDKQG